MFVIHSDEVDSIGTARGAEESSGSKQALYQLLIEFTKIQGRSNDIVAICATNRPGDLDDAFLRRFSCLIHVPLPLLQDRYAMLKHLAGDYNDLTEENFMHLAEMSDGFSSNDLRIAATDAIGFIYQEAFDASYFVEMVVDGKKRYQPCFDTSLKCVEMTHDDIASEEVMLRHLSFTDFEYAIKKLTPKVSPADVREMKKYARKYQHIVKRKPQTINHEK